ncbi:MAG: OprO/OprP family phosphate-selective porin [Planctomycetaceae bacterium]
MDSILVCFRLSSALRFAALAAMFLVIELEAVHGFATAGDQPPQNSISQEQRIDELERQMIQLQQTREQEQITGNVNDAIADPIPEQDLVHPASHVYNLAEPKSIFEGPKYPTVKLTGFFQMDAGWFHQDLDNRRTVGDVQDGADFRRARLAGTGDAWKNVGYMLEMDFAFPGRPSFMDVWLEVRELPVMQNLRVGQFRHPIGMDGQTSVRELQFIERSLPFAFLPFRQIGAMAYGHDDEGTSTWAVSVFRFPTDFWGGNVGDNGGYAMATRLTALPIYKEGERLVHLGVAYSGGDPSNDAVRYQAAPELFVSETGGAAFVPPDVLAQTPPFVDTGVVSANLFNIVGGELGAELHSLYFQSEVLASFVDQIGGSTVGFWGAYAQFGYFLTGEVRPYNQNNGVFGRVKPIHQFGSEGCGAWEVAMRWSHLDLSDNNIQGGELDNVTAGLNWYLNQFTKFQFNYLHAFLDRSPRGQSDADIVALRAQVDF